MKDFIVRTIAAYDAQGHHRTGTDVDRISGEWLAGEIKALGFEPILECFPFSRIDIDTATVRFEGEEWSGTPIFDGSYTTPDGITGTIGTLDSHADIAVAPILPNVTGPRRQAYEAARRDGRYQAMLAVTDDSCVTGGETLINADDYTRPFGPPALQLSSTYAARLKEGIKRHANATVIAAISRTQTEACNVGTVVRGQDPALSPLVVMTPRSGWWACASERGGGIACFLAILRTLRAQPPRRDVHFTANTGHELGHLGLDHYLDRQPGLLTRAHAWLHLGANFAAHQGEVMYQASDQTLMELGVQALSTRGVSCDRITPIGIRPRGEARNIYDGGGRYVSLLGSNPLFHHPDDRWPNAVDVDKTTRLAQAVVDLAMALAQ
jgi:hypothetical protein